MPIALLTAPLSSLNTTCCRSSSSSSSCCSGSGIKTITTKQNNRPMMSGRNGRESLLGSLNHHRRNHTFNNGVNNNHDDNLDLFNNNRRSLSLASSDDSSDVSVKLGRLSVGTAKPARSGIEDLLSSAEGGKHDYDWLLTPPGTPGFPSSEGEPQSTLAPPRRSMSRSTSTTKSSRLSVSQSESNNHSRPARSSSVTRSSISNSHSQYNNYSSNRSPTTLLNTSSASVSSYIRPSSPVTRSTSSARPSTPSSRPTASRSSTPSRVRSVSTSSSADKHRPTSQSSRPSTPSSSRPQVPANLHSPSAPPNRSLSRPSTPTRRSSLPSLSPSPTTSSSTSAGRVSLLNGRSSAPTSRPSSPSPRVRPPPQPVVPPDFPLDTPPNLRTTLPDRPVSAGRSRPGAATLKGNSSETQASVNMPRRHSSPIVSRGRLTEPASKSRGYASANGHHADVPETRRAPHTPEVVARKSVKASTTATDNSGFGRSISKKSLDMAIKHMDIRNSSGNLRSLSNTTLFPQSIRNSTPKSQSHRASSAPPVSVDMNGSLPNNNNGANSINRNMIKGREIDERQYSAKLSEVDIYESSRYDALLLKEDLKNTSWLHSVDDKCDQGPLFDNGFEHLPEPFGLL